MHPTDLSSVLYEHFIDDPPSLALSFNATSLFTAVLRIGNVTRCMLLFVSNLSRLRLRNTLKSATRISFEIGTGCFIRKLNDKLKLSSVKINVYQKPQQQ